MPLPQHRAFEAPTSVAQKPKRRVAIPFGKIAVLSLLTTVTAIVPFCPVGRGGTN